MLCALHVQSNCLGPSGRNWSIGSFWKLGTVFSPGDQKDTFISDCPRILRLLPGGVLSPGAINVSTCDYWDLSVIGSDIATKETLALNNALQSFGNTVRNSWVDAFVDSQVLLHSWNRRGSRSHSLTALKCLFETFLNLNIDLRVHYIRSPENPANSPSLRLSFQDSKLLPAVWALLQNLYGGPEGQSIDLMARPSNVQTDLCSKPQTSPLVNALGVNVFAQSSDFYGPEVFSNPYVFAPIYLNPQIFKYINSLKLPYTL